ncbi:hypothetical protein AGLY_010456 [Aphis glycines]|uniref:Uncharacterized protein n=1 Tax=Aphis glycines TaxID=307491 RepID=A0A6G0TEY2_APHGL|nr:hypothetical protein AGLY_010456 [Aphis glycines]
MWDLTKNVYACCGLNNTTLRINYALLNEVSAKQMRLWGTVDYQILKLQNVYRISLFLSNQLKKALNVFHNHLERVYRGLHLLLSNNVKRSNSQCQLNIVLVFLGDHIKLYSQVSCVVANNGIWEFSFDLRHYIYPIHVAFYCIARQTQDFDIAFFEFVDQHSHFTQLSGTHWCKIRRNFMGPLVVTAEKSGMTEPKRMAESIITIKLKLLNKDSGEREHERVTTNE